MRLITPPHYRRLVERLAGIDAPLIRVWGWPGTGKRPLLRAMAEDPQLATRVLVPAEVNDPQRLADAVGRGHGQGARWFLWEGGSPEECARIRHHLAPAQSLIFTATEDQPPSVGEAWASVEPQELLLRDEEAQLLWRQVTSSRPPLTRLRDLLTATDGWYEPLRLLITAHSHDRPSDETLAELAADPLLESFVRHRVLPLLSPPERDLLLDLSLVPRHSARRLRDAWAVNDDAREALEGLLRGRAWFLSEGQELRLPHVLQAFLTRERKRSWSTEEEAKSRRRVGVALAQGGRTVEALEHLVAADTPLARDSVAQIRRLVDEEWLGLLAGAPTETLRRALISGDPSPSPAQALLRHLLTEVEAVKHRGGEDLRGLATPLCGGAQRGGHLVVLLVACVLDFIASSPESQKGPLVWPDWAQWAAATVTLAAPLRALGYLGEAVAHGEGGDPESARRALDRAAALAPRSRTGSSVAQRLFQLAQGKIAERWPELEAKAQANAQPEPPAAELDPGRCAETRAAAPGNLGPEYRFRLFASPTLEQRQEDGLYGEVHWPLRRALMILAYISSTPGMRVGKDKLVEAIWPGADDDTIRRNFHPTVSRLRRSLEQASTRPRPALLFHNGVYRLNPELRWEIDVLSFEQRTREGREYLEEDEPDLALGAWERAWSLYRGPFLTGYDDPWVLERRNELQRLYLYLLRELGDFYLRRERLSDAEDAYRCLLVEDPLQENVYVQIMRIYARRGRRDLVRRQYERLGNLLLEELGTEPTPETSAEYHRLMS